MQTNITADMPFGIPGTHANGQPWRADPFAAGGLVTFGGPAFVKSDGTVKNSKSTDSDAATVTYAGMFVGPEQHVRWVLPDADPSITLDPSTLGFEVAVAARGSWVCKVASVTVKDGSDDPVTTRQTWAVGDAIGVGYDYDTVASSTHTWSGDKIFRKTATGDSATLTTVAHVVKVSDDGSMAIIRLGE